MSMEDKNVKEMMVLYSDIDGRLCHTWAEMPIKTICYNFCWTRVGGGLIILFW